MIRLLGNPWALLALVAALTAWTGYVGARAYHAGEAAVTARHAAEIERAREAAAQAAEIASRREADRLAAEAERDAMAMELEDAARMDPGAGACGIGLDGVRRLNRL